MVVRKQWLTMGVDGKILKTRAVGWLCKDINPLHPGYLSCLELDPDWSREAYKDAPGTAAKRTPVTNTHGL